MAARRLRPTTRRRYHAPTETTLQSFTFEDQLDYCGGVREQMLQSLGAYARESKRGPSVLLQISSPDYWSMMLTTP